MIVVCPDARRQVCLCVYSGWDVSTSHQRVNHGKYKYSVTVLQYMFHVFVLYSSICETSPLYM